jgi:hypothetical protein
VQALTALAVLAPACFATVINFDSLAGPTALTNQFAAQGILFDSIEGTNQFATSVVAVSAPFYATPFYSSAASGLLWFVDPSNNQTAYVSNVSITMNGYNNVGGWFDGATIEALDATNTVIAGQTQVVNPSNGVNYGSTTLTFTGQVHALEFINILNTSGLGILPFDDVTFGALTDAPEPSTSFLIGVSMMGLFFIGRLRRA